jgi:hypothetical protein
MKEVTLMRLCIRDFNLSETAVLTTYKARQGNQSTTYWSE